MNAETSPALRNVVQFRMLRDSEVEDASQLARRVFNEFVATQYGPEGQAEFHRYAAPDALQERHRSGCVTFAAEREGRLIGMLHMRNGDHIAMLFVEGECQRQGVGRRLIGAATEYALGHQPPVHILTVAATPNALRAYLDLGFIQMGEEQMQKGIRFIPMELRITAAPLPHP